eukprot:402856-Amphidinium_carterae.1
MAKQDTPTQKNVFATHLERRLLLQVAPAYLSQTNARNDTDQGKSNIVKRLRVLWSHYWYAIMLGGWMEARIRCL